MSVATELAPAPAPVRVPAPSRCSAAVTVLHPPRDPAGTAAPIRLTRRGVLVLTFAVLALGVGLIWAGRASAPRAAVPAPAPHTVTVRPGDTLWAIAGRAAPQRDPRAEVAALEQRNHLTGPQLVPGQVLVVP